MAGLIILDDLDNIAVVVVVDDDVDDDASTLSAPSDMPRTLRARDRIPATLSSTTPAVAAAAVVAVSADTLTDTTSADTCE